MNELNNNLNKYVSKEDFITVVSKKVNKLYIYDARILTGWCKWN